MNAKTEGILTVIAACADLATARFLWSPCCGSGILDWTGGQLEAAVD
ncbi:MAG: hypothetical protein P8Y14_26195 [Anaerolineales bacterium]|jgi:hypothetical protein